MKLNGLLSVIMPSLREPQPCESCQQPFTCGASLAGCWCTEVKVSKGTREQLKAKYKQCLCRTCLEKAEVEFSGINENREILQRQSAKSTE